MSNQDDEKYKWTNKNREERVKPKMLFLFFVGGLLIITLLFDLNSDKSEDDKKISNKDGSETKDSIERDFSDEAEGIEDDYKEKDDSEKGGNKEESNKDMPEGHEEGLTTDANEYEEEYVDKFGDDLVNGLKSGSKDIMSLYFERDTENEKWDKVATKKFQDNIKENLADKKRDPDPDSYDSFTTKPYNDDEIIIGVIVNIDDKAEYYNLIFNEEDNQMLLDEIVFMWDN